MRPYAPDRAICGQSLKLDPTQKGNAHPWPTASEAVAPKTSAWRNSLWWLAGERRARKRRQRQLEDGPAARRRLGRSLSSLGC